MNILLTVLTVMTAAVWGFLLGTMQPTVSGSNDLVKHEICEYSKTTDSSDWKEACNLAKEMAKK